MLAVMVSVLIVRVPSFTPLNATLSGTDVNS